MLSVPVVANGDLYSQSDCDQVVKSTGVDGVMIARGALENPALFATELQDSPLTRLVDLFSDYCMIAASTPLSNARFVHHLYHFHTFSSSSLSRSDRRELISSKSLAAVKDFMEEKNIQRSSNQQSRAQKFLSSFIETRTKELEQTSTALPN